MIFKNTIFRMALVLFMAALVLMPSSFAFAEPVVLVDFSFDSVQIHNRIAGFILEHGYHREADYLFTESMPGFLGLERGNIDVSMESWVDNIPKWWTKVQKEETVYNAGRVFQDAPQAWYVPAYVIHGDEPRGIEPLAPDLKKVSDLKKHWKLFEEKRELGKARFYNCPSGWACNAVNISKIEAYGLGDYITAFDPGSDTALSTAIATAYERGKPILAYNWEPTAVIGKYDMVMLEEPEYDEEVWKENFGCAYPAATVLLLLNAKFAEDNPELKKFFDRYETTLDQTNKALAYMKDSNTDPEGAAVWFLKKYSEDWKMWVNDEEKILRVEMALKDLK